MEGEAEVGVAAVEGQFPSTGPPYLSRLAIDSDWCPQQEKVVVAHCVGGEAKLAGGDLGTGQGFIRGHGCWFV